MKKTILFILVFLTISFIGYTNLKRFYIFQKNTNEFVTSGNVYNLEELNWNEYIPLVPPPVDEDGDPNLEDEPSGTSEDGSDPFPPLPGENNIVPLCYNGGLNNYNILPDPSLDQIGTSNMQNYWNGKYGTISSSNLNNQKFNVTYSLGFTSSDAACPNFSPPPPYIPPFPPPGYPITFPSTVYHHSIPIQDNDFYTGISIKNLPNQPLVLRLGNECRSAKSETVSKTFEVSCDKPKLYFKYAAVLEIDHTAASLDQQSIFGVRVYDDANRLIQNVVDIDPSITGNQEYLQAGSGSASFSHSNPLYNGTTIDVNYVDWTCGVIDLTNFVGSNSQVRVEFYTKDGSNGNSFGYAYIKDLCDVCVGTETSLCEDNNGGIGSDDDDHFVDDISYFPGSFTRTRINIYKRNLDPIVPKCSEGGFESGDQNTIRKNWYGRNGKVKPGCNTGLNEMYNLNGLFRNDIGCGNPATHHKITDAGVNDPYTGLSTVNSGNHAIRLGNRCRKFGTETLSKRFFVHPDSVYITFWYSAVLNHPGGTPAHTACELPIFGARIFDGNNTVAANVIDLDPTTPGNQDYLQSDNSFLTTHPNDSRIRYNNWTCAAIDLSSFAGQTITLEFYTKDCNHDNSTHFAYAYLDDFCVLCPNSKEEGETGINIDKCLVDPNNKQLLIPFTLPNIGSLVGTINSITFQIKNMKGVTVATGIYTTIPTNPLVINLAPYNLDPTKKYELKVTANFTFLGKTIIKSRIQNIGNCCDDSDKYIEGK